MKASFRLDPKEVHNFKFNDKIWVKDSWFFVQSINDYPVGEKAIVEVDMIKVPDSITPPTVVPATGGVSGQCFSVSYCNNETDLDAEAVAFQYVDCDLNLRSETLYPSTCISVCALYPNPYPLPAKFTEIVNGNCPGGVYATAGAFIELDLQGNNFIAENKITTAILSGATAGPTGTFIPLQYFSVLGDDSIVVDYNVPFGYGAKFDLIFANGASGASIFDMEISLATNGVTGATAYRMITYQPISATYPAGITGANYTALCRIDY